MPAPQRSPLTWLLVGLIGLLLLGLALLFLWPRASVGRGMPTVTAPPVTASHPTSTMPGTTTAARPAPTPVQKEAAATTAPAAFGAWRRTAERPGAGPIAWRADYTADGRSAHLTAARGDDVAHATWGLDGQVDGPHTRCGRTGDEVRCAVALRDGVVVLLLPGTDVAAGVRTAEELAAAL